MFLLPVFLLLFPNDSLSHTFFGLSAGSGHPFGGYGLRVEVLRTNVSPWRTGFSGSLGLSGENWFPDSRYLWLGNALTINWETGEQHRLGFSAGLASQVLAGKQSVQPIPARKFLIGPMASAAYVYRATGGFFLTSGFSLKLIQRPFSKENAFRFEPGPFLGIGWNKSQPFSALPSGRFE